MKEFSALKGFLVATLLGMTTLWTIGANVSESRSENLFRK